MDPPPTSYGSLDVNASWACARCTLENSLAVDICEACENPRPAKSETKPTVTLSEPRNDQESESKSVVIDLEGTWTCSCGYSKNPSSALFCHSCAKKFEKENPAPPPREGPCCQLCWEDTAEPWDVKQVPEGPKVIEENGKIPAVLLVCTHICCKDCIEGWVTVRLGEGKTHMPCPLCPTTAAPSKADWACEFCSYKQNSPSARYCNSCAKAPTPKPQAEVLREELPTQVIVKFAGQEAADKLERFRKDRAMESSPNVVWCFDPACAKAGLPTGKSRRVECEHCHKATCRKCKKAYHSFPRCTGTDPFMAAWEADAIANGRELKACPGCKRKTEREGGCLNITCNCGLRYCWVCLMAWPCPNGCGLKKGADGTQNAQAAPQNLKSARGMYLRRMGMCTLAVIAGAFIAALLFGGYSIVLGFCLVCCPCVFVAKCCYAQTMEDEYEDLDSMINWVVGITLGVALSPLIAAVAFICTIPGIFYLIYILMFGACIDTGFRHSLYSPLVELQGSQNWLDPAAAIYQKYTGPLPAKAVVVGRVSLVILWLCFMLPIGAVFAVVTAPIAPLFLLPVCICPSLSTSKWLKALVALLFLAGSLALYFAWTVAPLALRVAIPVLIFVVGLGVAFRTPTSDWAFLGPLWQGALAPCAAILGFVNSVNPENNPFSGPVPFPGPYVLIFEDWNGHIAL